MSVLFACVCARAGGGAGAADPRVIISCSYFKFYNIIFFAYGREAEDLLLLCSLYLLNVLSDMEDATHYI